MIDWKSIFKYADVLIAALALAAPQRFVQSVAHILEVTLPLDTTAALSSYSLFLLVIAIGASWIRKSGSASGSAKSNKSVAIECFIAIGGLAMIATSLNSGNTAITPEQLTTPYAAYAASVFLCLGTGYATLDVVRSFGGRN